MEFILSMQLRQRHLADQFMLKSRDSERKGTHMNVRVNILRLGF